MYPFSIVTDCPDLAPKPREQWLNIARRMHAALAGQYALFDEPPEVLEVLDTARARAHRRGSSPRARTPRSSRPTISVDPERVAVESVREAGTVHLGLAFWKRMGFDAALEAAGLSERTRVLTCAMVMNRLIAPAMAASCSPSEMNVWLRSAASRRSGVGPTAVRDCNGRDGQVGVLTIC